MRQQQITLLVFAILYKLVLVEASLAAITCALGKIQACSRGAIRNYYDGIDTYLKEHLKTEDVNATMEAIENWIKLESTHKQTLAEVQRLKALVQLHSLVQIEGLGKCSLSSSRILQNNDLAVGGAISKLSPGEIPKRRIERLINHYASQFLRDCDHELMVKEVSPTTMDYVKKIISEYISIRAREDSPFTIFQSKAAQSESFVDYSPYEASNYAKSLKGIRPGDSALIHRLLKKLATENFDAQAVKYLSRVRQGDSKKKVVDGVSVFKIYRKYVGKPCEEFTEKVESSFGSQWALKLSKKIHKRLNTEKPLYTNLSYYYGCSLLLHNEEKLIDGLKMHIEQFY